MDRALELAGGILPLSADWLSQRFSCGRATAARWWADQKVSSGHGAIPGRHLMAVYSLFRQRCPSKVLIRADMPDPEVKLSQLLGCQLRMFRKLDVTVEVNGQTDNPNI